jgi:acetyl-CoA synthetase
MTNGLPRNLAVIVNDTENDLMKKLSEYTKFEDAQREFTVSGLWQLLDGDKQQLNIAHEAVDRHANSGRTAVRVAHADGRDEVISFADLSVTSSQVAHWLKSIGVEQGDRVGVMVDPSLAFYSSLFGIIKSGAIAVPLFTLFGIDGLRTRADDCGLKVLIVAAEKAEVARQLSDVLVVVADEVYLSNLVDFPSTFEVTSKSDDHAVFQYTSGTTRAIPTAVKHTNRSIVYLMIAALYATGIRPGDRFFCPSSTAWGHGLWHGTLGPLTLGITTGTVSGKFDPDRFARALSEYEITALSAAPTHFRILKSSGAAGKYSYSIDKLSYTGEPLDSSTAEFIEEIFGTIPRSMYGTTEVGTVLVNYPGAEDYVVRRGSLGKEIPGTEVDVHDSAGVPCKPGETGELVVRRGGDWLSTKDRGSRDAEGYFYYGGRSDDVIISAGWTMSAMEIEDVLLKHDAVIEAAVVGVPDELRGLIPKAFLVCCTRETDGLVKELQDFAKSRLSLHEYPREIEFVETLPTTPAGKVNRKALRDRAANV